MASFCPYDDGYCSELSRRDRWIHEAEEAMLIDAACLAIMRRENEELRNVIQFLLRYHYSVLDSQPKLMGGFGK